MTTKEQALSWIEEYHQVEADLKVLESRKKTLRAKMEKYLEDLATDEAEIHGHAISNKTVVSNRIDTKRLKEHFADVAAECTVETQTKRFLVK